MPSHVAKPPAAAVPLCAQVLRDVIQGRATARPAPSDRDRDRVSGVAGLSLLTRIGLCNPGLRCHCCQSTFESGLSATAGGKWAEIRDKKPMAQQALSQTRAAAARPPRVARVLAYQPRSLSLWQATGFNPGS